MMPPGGQQIAAEASDKSAAEGGGSGPSSDEAAAGAVTARLVAAPGSAYRPPEDLGYVNVTSVPFDAKPTNPLTAAMRADRDAGAARRAAAARAHDQARAVSSLRYAESGPFHASPSRYLSA